MRQGKELSQVLGAGWSAKTLWPGAVGNFSWTSLFLILIRPPALWTEPIGHRDMSFSRDSGCQTFVCYLRLQAGELETVLMPVDPFLLFLKKSRKWIYYNTVAEQEVGPYSSSEPNDEKTFGPFPWGSLAVNHPKNPGGQTAMCLPCLSRGGLGPARGRRSRLGESVPGHHSATTPRRIQHRGQSAATGF